MEFGMVMEVKLLHPSKQLHSSLLTDSGMVMEIKLLQNWYLQLVVYQQILI